MFAVNCFEGKLNSDICLADQLQVLSLNGLQASDNCNNIDVIPLTDVHLYNMIGGTVPFCFWRMKNLTVLHLAGNGLTGELPRALPQTSKLSDLSLAHNKLRGTISADILRIHHLDLSYNMLSGEYTRHIELLPGSSIVLEINRLSGNLPDSELEGLWNRTVKILKGNIFSCNSIPENDENSQEYVCGSRNLNSSLLLFASVFSLIVLILIVVIIGIYFKRFQNGCLAYIRHNYDLLQMCWSCYKRWKVADELLSSIMQKILQLREVLIVVGQYGLALSGIILSGSVVFYVVKVIDSANGKYYSTHSHTYAWFWSMAYMRGYFPAMMIIFIWGVVMSVCFWCISPGLAEVSGKGSTTMYYFRTGAVPVLIPLLLNVSVTVVVNAFYIYLTQQQLGHSALISLQFSLSIYRMLYVSMAFPLLSRHITELADKVHFQFVLLTINNLLIPCLVAAFTSDSCFQVRGNLVYINALAWLLLVFIRVCWSPQTS